MSAASVKDWRPRAGLKIDRLYAWVVTEPDGGEGVAGAMSPLGWVPLVGADMARIESFRGPAEQIAQNTGFPVRLVVFEGRRDLDLIATPAAGGGSA